MNRTILLRAFALAGALALPLAAEPQTALAAAVKLRCTVADHQRWSFDGERQPEESHDAGPWTLDVDAEAGTVTIRSVGTWWHAASHTEPQLNLPLDALFTDEQVQFCPLVARACGNRPGEDEIFQPATLDRRTGAFDFSFRGGSMGDTLEGEVKGQCAKAQDQIF